VTLVEIQQTGFGRDAVIQKGGEQNGVICRFWEQGRQEPLMDGL